MLQTKNTPLGKAKVYILIFFSYYLLITNSLSENNSRSENYAVLTILDKVNSQSDVIEIEVGMEYKFKNLSINILKCNNSKFDDDPEVTAYMQVRDTVIKDDNMVFIFNDWTFASSPSIRPFDHPVYDIWLKKCYS
ncbi:hypothetical protein AKH18_01645 [Pelagibacteraceae bacterium GOM-A4]|nr:hypothetical protein AKH18_02070 [Pelagibacteraceae bacterium GOM-A4]OCW83422.1 hypothetical protein AKH18_01645 [Pelagibacteraceae bacterium GOM-A4]